MTESRFDAHETAQQRRLDALVDEVAHGGPDPELAARIAARLDEVDTEPVAPTRSGRWLAAALLLIGASVVAAIAAWPRDGDRAPGSGQPATQPEGARQQDPQPQPPAGQQAEPQTPQDPAPATTDPAVEKLLRDLELADRRDAAVQQLVERGEAALPVIEAALQNEQRRGRTLVADALAAARAAIVRRRAVAAIGWPDGPITLFADYSDNTVVAVDQQGQVVWRLDEVFGTWDAELTAAGTVLVTEFSVSRVREIDRDGKVVWSYGEERGQLKNPYDADRLPNGHTLIANTFGGEVIELDEDGEVVWRRGGVRPFDADRLPNFNTLIADTLGNRVIEVDPDGDIVWQVDRLNNPHDADRLPNGNTLITLRSDNAVVEVDADGKVVWRLDDLVSPSDADRLPNGNTLVAENGQIREFDREGAQVWRRAATWVVEVQRY